MELRLEESILIYDKGNTRKEFDLANASAVTPSHKPIAWKLVLRGDDTKSEGQVYEFLAGTFSLSKVVLADSSIAPVS